MAGGHGQIAMLLHSILKSNGHQVFGIIRNEEHADEVREAGAEPVICDIEKSDDISDAVGEVDAVVFAAGAGPGSGAARKWTVDRDGALKLIEAAKKNNIRRYVMISAMKVEEPRGNEVFQVYQKAKAEADKALRESGLDYTIIRPGRLIDDLPRGRVSLAPDLPGGEIPRADVAAVVAEVLESPESVGHQWDLVTGDMEIDKAIRNAASTGGHHP
ncbi:SDR family oxidoreductase [Balneolales bacterium ANBcel1]|nr:SDR family oxidoreductase [Balneolales bacterium ANBcel1]